MSTYVVDITDAVPPSSSIAWATATLGESGSRTGPFTQIDTFTLVPDPDPTQPAERSFHSTKATLAAGWYQLTWIDPVGDLYVADPIWAGYGLRPAVQDVARLMPDRTTIDGGTQAGTFNSLTTPTDTAVNAMIDMVLDSVTPLISSNDSISQRLGRWVIALKTAELIELSYYSEQVQADDGRITAWRALVSDNLNIVSGAGTGATNTFGDPWVMSGPAPVDTISAVVDGELLP